MFDETRRSLTCVAFGLPEMKADEHYMRLALQAAEAAGEQGEVAVGCVLVGHDGEVLASGHNETNRSCNGVSKDLKTS